ncbi:MAG: hypothetical protein UY45_C0003G0103 [Parcubacteria group bacterium GW2011_GWA1_49_26]|uniref:Uncharacterized protein n=1 Tax=Candidatus Yanofskybacteria bacterium GW2011_GWC1_48_11 TaxID=1619027 RepID=A0A837IPC6_9BACT|nr:MAG: hypothetical protein UY25_C0001G0024 [Candidatus Yanofskybacteria bacterium GW2011_GWC1_48_11]KKW04003.1 MAG: hypothetical protein UY38_C0002G0157 [Parcubacteria group bacterium GW2011_GWB1_49_12]KKW08896.1 MAG: hypothetical protein UY45_C0003G0103 [Parcubacteria group bacterium GW2011_GWA1_49_26]
MGAKRSVLSQSPGRAISPRRNPARNLLKGKKAYNALSLLNVHKGRPRPGKHPGAGLRTSEGPTHGPSFLFEILASLTGTYALINYAIIAMHLQTSRQTTHAVNAQAKACFRGEVCQCLHIIKN